MINLIAHMGLCSGVTIIRHFLDHYYRLGVDRFLIILHTEAGQEPLREETLQILDAYGTSPAMEVSDYTYLLRRERINMLLDKAVEAEEWVLHADIDEFHIYPDTLKLFLQQCDRDGQTFIQGKWVDRIAANKKLNAISEAPSLWSQFPLMAKISDLGCGWTVKVCAAKGFHRSGDGGTHSVDSGLLPPKNYEQSSIHKGRYPNYLAIDHFKWDSTVIRRLQARAQSYRLHGLSVFEESARILSHLDPDGELSIPACTPSPRQFHYIRPSVIPLISKGI
jgi:hypothetical protein